MLPALAPRLPCPIPTPVWFGRPDATYKWPFLGYRRLDGQVASDLGLDEHARAALAAPLARFLRALHDVPLAEAQAWGAPPDKIRLSRRDQDRASGASGAEPNWWHAAPSTTPSPWLEVLDAGLAVLPLPGALGVVHGDFYSRHILVDDAGRMAGVIDFGDLHLDHPALDLSVAWTVLPPRARPEFFAIYGEVDDRARAVARLRALTSGLAQEAYGRDVGDAKIEREGVLSLHSVIA